MLDFDVPNDETATAMLLRLGAQGNVQTTTTRTFTATELLPGHGDEFPGHRSCAKKLPHR
jgi:hypothetical protein